MIIGITPYLYFYDTMDPGFFKMEIPTEKLAFLCADGRIHISQSFSD